MKPAFKTEEEKIAWIEGVIRKFEEGSASPEEIADFRELLLADAGARRIYRDSNELSALLEIVKSPLSEVEVKSRPIPKIIWWSGAAVALIAVGLWLGQQPGESPPPLAQTPSWFASLSASNEAIWIGAEPEGGQFASGTFELKSGTARLEFKNEAHFVIEGPCRFTIIDGDSIELKRGNLWGYCPPSAHGFEVRAPGGHRVIDLGTEFGIAADISGSVDVHVFDGEVEVFSGEQAKQALEAGSAIQLMAGKEPVSLTADASRFTDRDDFQSDFYRSHRQALLKRDDLIHYFDFSESEGKVLRDQMQSRVVGVIHGSPAVRGRMAGKSARLFEETSNAVSLDLRETELGNEFTLVMWIKPTEIEKSHIALLNTEGYGPGAVHFQILNSGAIASGVMGEAGYLSARGLIQKNEWQFVGVTWNLKSGQTRFYYNGEPVMTEKRKGLEVIEGVRANLGQCQIGKWAKPTYGHTRNFVGRIGELNIFSQALAKKEMRNLFLQGKP